MLINFILFASAIAATGQTRHPRGGEVRVGSIAGFNWNYVDAEAQDYIEAPEGSSLGGHVFRKSTAFSRFGGIQADYDFSEILGVHARLAYDDRFITNHNTGADFNARLSYLSFEPALRLTNSAQTRIFLMAGPSIHFNLGRSYDFIPTASGDVPIRNGEIEYAASTVFGVWVSLGMDIPLSVDQHGVGLYITPFFDDSYIFNQVAWDSEDHPVTPGEEDEYSHQWYTVTLRGGLGIKYSFGSR
jgi:hypothetical protein